MSQLVTDTPGHDRLPSRKSIAVHQRLIATAAPAYCATMASLRVLAFDHEGRPVQFDTWLDDLQLYLLSDIKDTVSLFDHVSAAAIAPPAKADSATRSQWLSRDTAARLAIRNHLPIAECTPFGQHRTAQALFNAVVARYSSPATAALGRLLLPYVFPELSAFATVEDLVSHLRASDARYRAAAPAEDHFLSLDPTSLTVDLLEKHLLAAQTSAVAVGAARGTPRPPFFEGCSPSPLAPSYASAAAANVSVAEDVGAASASAKHRSSKGKGGRGGGSGKGGGGGGSGSSGGGSSGGGGGGGTGGGSGGSGGGGGGSGGSGSSGGGGTGGGGTGARRAGSGGGQRQQQRRSEIQSPQQLREWFLQRGASRDLLRSRIAIFDLDFDAILSAMYALSVSAEGDCYRCVLPNPGIAAAALGASESGTLPDTEPPGVAASAQVSASGQVAASCSCRLLSHQTLMWHHRLGHPSLPCLRGMHSRLLVSGLPRSLPPLPSSPAPPCLRCVEGRQRAAPHSSSFPSTTAPLQTLHMNVWGPARVSGQGRERYFLLVVDDYTRGGEFSSNLLRDFCRGEGILLSFKLLDSPQKNEIAERRIGVVMELNLCPRVSLPETSPTLRWTGEVGDASVFRVWGSRAFVRDTSADKLSACAIPCVILGFVPDAPGWQFYHPTSRRVFPSQDVTFDESVPFYRLFAYRSAPTLPPPLFLAPGTPVAVGSGATPGAASGGAEPGGAESEGAGSGGAEPGGEEPGDAKPAGVEPGGVELGGAESEGAESGGAEPWGAASSGGPASASPRLSPQQLREWFVRRARLRSEATGDGGSGDIGAGGAGVTVGAGGTSDTAATGPEGACTRGTGVAAIGGVGGAGAGDPTELGAVGAEGTGAGGSRAGGAGAAGAGAVDPGAGGAGDTPTSPLPAPPPYTEQSGGLIERREPESLPFSPVRTARRVPRSRPPPVPGMHAMALCPSSVPLRVPLHAPPESSLPAIPDPESERARATSPTNARLLATAVTDPSFDLRLPVLRPSGAAMDAEMASWKSTCTYVDEVPPPVAKIVDGMWIFRVKRPPGSPPAFKARYFARGFKALTLVKSELQKRHTCNDLGELRSYLGLQITWDKARRTITLTPSHMVHQVLQRFVFQFSSLQPTPVSTSHPLSAPPSDESVEPSGPYPELVGCLMYVMTYTRPDLAYPLSLLACYVAPCRHRKVHWDAAKRVLRYLCSTSGMGLVLGGRGPVVLTGHADASWADDSATQRLS
ncbi:unnamed protein product [Closterium sp. NIES-54]